MTKDRNQDQDTPVVRSRDLPATKGMIDDLRAEMHSGFMRIEHQFKGVDHKFVGIDKHFEQVDARFDQVDARFDQVDKRFDELTELIKASMAHSTQRYNEAKAISEDQRAQNLFALDAYNVVNDRLENHEARIKRIEEDKGI